MKLRLNCPKCGLPKLSHSIQDSKVISIRCRQCGWAKEFNKPKAFKDIKDTDYES